MNKQLLKIFKSMAILFFQGQVVGWQQTQIK